MDPGFADFRLQGGTSRGFTGFESVFFCFSLGWAVVAV